MTRSKTTVAVAIGAAVATLMFWRRKKTAKAGNGPGQHRSANRDNVAA